MPSAPSGNASIYLGLTGPVLGAARLSASAEASVSIACSFLGLGVAEAMVAGGAEPRDTVVDRVLAPLHVDGAGGERPGGAACLLLEANAPEALAEVVLCRELSRATELPDPGEGAVVITTLSAERHDAVLGDGAWAAVPRRALHSGLGRAEASSGYALVAAAALVARGEASEALVLGGMRSAVMATLLRKPGA